jgi:hypothetical protein
MKLFALILGEANDRSLNFIGLSYGKYFFRNSCYIGDQEVMELSSRELNQCLAMSLRAKGNRRILKASSVKTCELMVEHFSKNLSRNL